LPRALYASGSISRTKENNVGKLEGRTAVITGASSGIGLATAKLFAAEGAHVFITGRRKAELDAAVKAIGAQATGVQGDAANLADLDRLYEVVKADCGRIDVLVANAGIGDVEPLGAITASAFDRAFGVNVKGTLFTVQKALPLFTGGGSVIMIGSIAGSKGLPGFSVYNASKAAIRSFARTWTVDLKGRGIRVNVLSPGTIDTPALEHLPKEAIDQIISATPLGRMGTSDEVAKAAVFLACEDSSFITGIELFIDGGMAQI
jgi:NAD(P)-dependent dehydrogenase (short-subunit alcohol dehydrogenase family)